jgi:hypothetical protein
MKTFTVVGFYEDNGQRFCASAEAEDWVDAITSICQTYTEGELVIVEVFEGDLLPLTESCQIEYRDEWPGFIKVGDES